jgi:hypothetical protein
MLHVVSERYGRKQHPTSFPVSDRPPKEALSAAVAATGRVREGGGRNGMNVAREVEEG